MATTVKKPLSAVDAALQEINTEGFRLTDDIVIPKPTRAVAKQLQGAQSEEDVLAILCGEQWPAAKAVLESLPLAAEVRVMEMLLKDLSADLPTVEELITRMDLDADTAAKVRAATE